MKFERDSISIVMSGGKQYEFPVCDKEVNFIRVKAGMITFGESNLTVDFFYSRKKLGFGKFLQKQKELFSLILKKIKRVIIMENPNGLIINQQKKEGRDALKMQEL